MDKLKAFETFAHIVERGSLTAAADHLGTSLPSVVRTLAALESHLGVRLLHRTTRRLSLTEDGRQVLERARRILDGVDEVERSVGQQALELSGALRVTAPVLFGQYHVAPAVMRFLPRHPLLRIDLVLLDRVVNLVEEGIDVGVRIGHLQDSSVVAQQVGRIRRVVVAAPAFLRRHGAPAHPRDLARAPCVTIGATDGNVWPFREGGRSFSVTVSGPLQCNLAAPMLQACAAGLGFGRCLSYQAAPLVAARQLRIVLADYEVEPWPVHLIYPSARLLPARTRAFIEAMKAELRSAVN